VLEIKCPNGIFPPKILTHLWLDSGKLLKELGRYSERIIYI
jgi:hypothetical protein